jgi:hypothetical protein
LSMITGGFFGYFPCMHYIQHCFICRPSDSTEGRRTLGSNPGQLRLRQLAVRSSCHTRLYLIHKLGYISWCSTLIKKKIKFSLYIRKFSDGEVGKSNMTNGLLKYMVKYLLIFLLYYRKPVLIYDFATAPLRISLNTMKIWSSFLSM